MALGNGSAANGGVAQEKAPVVNGTNVETLPRTGKQVGKNEWCFWIMERKLLCLLFVCCCYVVGTR